MRMFLIRHTRPADPDGICYGVTDVDVAPTFGAEAARVIAALPVAERLVTSPLRRCLRLAERIGASRDLEPLVDDRLREMDFGRWQGMAWDVIDRAELDAWAADFLDARPHGGESVRMVYERVGAALADYAGSGVPHAWVTHAGVIKAARARAGHADAWTSRVDYGGRICIEPPWAEDGAVSGPDEAKPWV